MARITMPSGIVSSIIPYAGTFSDIGALSGGVLPSMMGPQPVLPSVPTGTVRVVSPSGSGTTYSYSTPGNLQNGIWATQPGDTLYLKGGTYPITSQVNLSVSGTSLNRIKVESYPGERAILDGSAVARDGNAVRVNFAGSFIDFRLIDVMGMPKQGLDISGSDNLVEGCNIHHNSLSGIIVHFQANYDNLPAPYAYCLRNVIKNNAIYANSDAGLNGTAAGYALGGNADGITMSTGDSNVIRNNLIYGNSDDNIDIWRTTNSYVAYNILFGAGLDQGNGKGIKGGSYAPSANHIIERNIAYRNKDCDFDVNQGANVTMRYNTSYGSPIGFTVYADSIIQSNIAESAAKIVGTGIQTNNSWQRAGGVPVYMLAAR